MSLRLYADFGGAAVNTGCVLHSLTVQMLEPALVQRALLGSEGFLKRAV